MIRRIVVDFPAPFGRGTQSHDRFHLETQIVDGELVAVALREAPSLDVLSVFPDGSGGPRSHGATP